MSEWANRTLKDADVRVIKGEGLTSDKMVSGEIPVIAGGLSYCGMHNRANRNENCITVSASGANAGAVLFHKSKIFATDCSSIEWGGSQEFLYYALARRQKQFTSMQSGLAQPHVYPRDIEKIVLFYPTDTKEQSRIAAVLTATDEAVAASRALVEKYTAVKQGLMQNLLVIGELTRLDKVCSYIIGGSTPNTHESKYWGGSNIWITPTDLSVLNSQYISNSERKLTDAGLKRATGKLVPANSIIISCRAPVGYCAVVTEPFSFNQGCKALVCKDVNPMPNYKEAQDWLRLNRRLMEVI